MSLEAWHWSEAGRCGCGCDAPLLAWKPRYEQGELFHLDSGCSGGEGPGTEVAGEPVRAETSDGRQATPAPQDARVRAECTTLHALPF